MKLSDIVKAVKKEMTPYIKKAVQVYVKKYAQDIIREEVKYAMSLMNVQEQSIPVPGGGMRRKPKSRKTGRLMEMMGVDQEERQFVDQPEVTAPQLAEINVGGVNIPVDMQGFNDGGGDGGTVDELAGHIDLTRPDIQQLAAHIYGKNWSPVVQAQDRIKAQSSANASQQYGELAKSLNFADFSPDGDA
jgi:hypothetical protein